eukprot:11759945-Alexandrium_andersonii.AAC.1
MPALADGDPTKRICSFCECCLPSSISVKACVVVLVLPAVVPARADESEVGMCGVSWGTWEVSR